jgi:hypothetical protein
MDFQGDDGALDVRHPNGLRLEECRWQSDPGGSIPAWLVNRTQRHAAVDLVHAMLKRALEKNGEK